MAAFRAINTAGNTSSPASGGRGSQRALGLDDVALEGGPPFGVLAAGEQAGGDQLIELDLRAAGADQDGPALVDLSDSGCPATPSQVRNRRKGRAWVRRLTSVTPKTMAMSRSR